MQNEKGLVQTDGHIYHDRLGGSYSEESNVKRLTSGEVNSLQRKGVKANGVKKKTH